MRFYNWPALAVGALVFGAAARSRELPVVEPNPNVERSGVLRGGVLDVSLDATTGNWWIDGPHHPPMTVEAFAEPGKAPLMPGPLVRARQGTEIRLSVHNSLRTSLTFFVPAAVHGGPDRMTAMDSTVIAPGSSRQFVVRATAPGNYIYRATTPTGATRFTKIGGLLTGALIVDSAGVAARPNDRVLVLMSTPDPSGLALLDTLATETGDNARLRARTVYTINGRSWPNTERIPATIGDSIHWRVINASDIPHPMHLHGFYYRVDAFSDPLAQLDERPARGAMVVTQLMPPFSTMSISWAPDRPGNWIFHCHFALHNLPDSLSAAPDDPFKRDMVGLILGVSIADRPGAPTAAEARSQRRLRLVALTGPDVAGRGPDGVSSMHFAIDENGRRVDESKDVSPELDLTRGEPVSIVVVNQLHEPTSVHWHGIEVQNSYFDGVPGVSGAGATLTPAVAPGDSFEVRFTPPRSGTFMYHAHFDELREEIGGLEGALIVRDPGEVPSPDDDVFLLKGSANSRMHPIEINGKVSPDTVVLHVGRRARLRFANLTTTETFPTFSLTARPDSALTLERDTMLVQWTPIAKDGFNLPLAQQTRRAASLMIAMGETHDVSYTPRQRGTLRLEVRLRRNRRLLLRVPIRVE